MGNSRPYQNPHQRCALHLHPRSPIPASAQARCFKLTLRSVTPPRLQSSHAGSGIVVASMSSCPDAVDGWAGGNPRRFVQGAHPCTCCVLQVLLVWSTATVILDCKFDCQFSTSCVCSRAQAALEAIRARAARTTAGRIIPKTSPIHGWPWI
jgi:hypothetical protein